MSCRYLGRDIEEAVLSWITLYVKNKGHKKLMGQNVDEYELKKKLWLALCTVNILEGLRFYVSFACSFAFGELKQLEGSAKIISFIARDESKHLAISQKIIKQLT